MNCPVCQKPVVIQHYERGFALGCVGDRHCVQIYRCETQEEAVAAWRRFFPSKPEVQDASQQSFALEQ